jgi:hypothetical protein
VIGLFFTPKISFLFSSSKCAVEVWDAYYC